MSIRIILIVCWLFLGFSPVFSQDGRIRSSTGNLIGKTGNLRDYDPSFGRINTPVRDRHGLLWNRGKRKNPEIKWDPKARYLQEDPLRKHSAYQPVTLSTGRSLSPEVNTNQEGMTAAEITPADPTLCVGPAHIIQMINGPSGAYFQVFDKTGRALNNATYLDNLAPNSGYSGAGDGICLYDQFADRFVMMEFGTPSGSTDINTLIFYVSVTNDPLQSWYIYKFTDTGFFPDYPKISVWPDAWYATSRDFSLPESLFTGISFFAFNKQDMIAGNSTVRMQRTRLSDVEKLDGTAPVSVFGPTAPDAGAPGLFVFRNDDGRTPENDADSVGIFAFRVDFNNPANSRLERSGSIPTAPFNTTLCTEGGYFQACIPTPGANNKLMATTSFVMDKPVYRRFATHESLLLYHTVNAGGGGVAGIRWHELRRTVGNWQLYQEGTFSPDATHRFYPSMNMNSYGQIAAVYNASSSTLWPSIRVSGRNENDPLGSFPADETTIVTGSGYGTFSARWGDYNMIAPDPANDSIFWLTSMYGDPEGWKTRIASVKLPPNKDLDAKLNAILSPINGQSVCEPGSLQTSIQLANSGNQILESVTINWILNDGSVQTMGWTGTLAFGQTATLALPVPITEIGENKLQVFTSNPNNSRDERPSNDTMTVHFNVQQPITAVVEQGFENENFPPPGWRLLNPNKGSITWTRTTLAKRSGNAAAFLNIFNYNSPNDEDFLISPVIRLQGLDSIFIRFSHAYKAYSSGGNFSDTLKLVASVDCGNSFTRVLWRKGGQELASTGGTTGDINWVAGDGEWADNRLSIPVSTLGSAENLTLAWVTVNKFGQNIFLDDIQIEPYSLPNRDIRPVALASPGEQLCNSSFSPVLEIKNNGRDTLRQFRLELQLDNGLLVSRQVNGLALPSGQVYRLAYDSVFNLPSPGRHSLKVITKWPNGQPDQQAGNDTAVFHLFYFTEAPLPLVEGFENGSFPPSNWEVRNPGNNSGWQLNTNAGATGTRSAFIRNFTNPQRGDLDELMLPLLRAGNVDSIFLLFDLAYVSRRQAGELTDSLKIWLTRDCGQSRILLYSRWGSELQTVNNPAIPPDMEFIPSGTSQWRRDSINLTGIVNPNEAFQLVFSNTSFQNNNLYLDNINCYTVTLPAKLKSEGYLVAPNPTPGQFLVRHYRDQENLRRIEVVNALGQRVWGQSFNGNASNSIPVDISKHAAGMYVVRLVYTNSVRTTKILKTN